MWCIDGPLKSAYPELYRIARAKDAFVADNFQCRGDFIHWEVVGRIRCVGSLLNLNTSSCFGENLNGGEFKEEEGYYSQLVLFVQSGWGIC
uniref:Uncharacterized protein n=1 Tax=Fagus sylvatica TaxID=28930 RepID=A0A2N9GY33_FAGSY